MNRRQYRETLLTRFDENILEQFYRGKLGVESDKKASRPDISLSDKINKLLEDCGSVSEFTDLVSEIDKYSRIQAEER